MSSNLTESSGGSATFPANVVGPDDGDPAVAVSVRDGMTSLANRAQWLRALAADQVLNLLSDRSITAAPADATLLTQAVYAVRDTIATVVGGVISAAGNVYIDGFGKAFTSPFASLYVSASAVANGGSGAQAAEFRGASDADTARFYGSTSATSGNGYAGKFFGYSDVAALYANNTSYGPGGSFNSVNGDALEVTATAPFKTGLKSSISNANTIGLSVLNYVNSDSIGLLTNNRIQFAPILGTEPTTGVVPFTNALYAKNLLKSWGTFTSAGTQKALFNVTSLTTTATGEVEITFNKAFSNANYILTPSWSAQSPGAKVLQVRSQTATSCRIGCYQQSVAGSNVIKILSAFDADWGFTAFGVQP